MTREEATAKIRELSGEVADCLSEGLPHDTKTYRGSLLHELLEAALMLAARPASDGLRAAAEFALGDWTNVRARDRLRTALTAASAADDDDGEPVTEDKK